MTWRDSFELRLRILGNNTIIFLKSTNIHRPMQDLYSKGFLRSKTTKLLVVLSIIGEKRVLLPPPPFSG